LDFWRILNTRPGLQVSEEVEEELEATIKELTDERDRWVGATVVQMPWALFRNLDSPLVHWPLLHVHVWVTATVHVSHARVHCRITEDRNNLKAKLDDARKEVQQTSTAFDHAPLLSSMPPQHPPCDLHL